MGTQRDMAAVAAGKVAPSAEAEQHTGDDQRDEAASQAGQHGSAGPDQPAHHQRALGAEPVADPAADDLEDQVGVRKS
nr:hypothetical protein [Pseudomonas sp. VI4.1]